MATSVTAAHRHVTWNTRKEAQGKKTTNIGHAFSSRTYPELKKGVLIFSWHVNDVHFMNLAYVIYMPIKNNSIPKIIVSPFFHDYQAPLLKKRENPWHIQSFRNSRPASWSEVVSISGAFFIRFLHFFFAKCNLIRLRNTPTKSREAAPSHYGAMLKLDGNELYQIPVCFLSDFFTLFC
jgi:hypothetical protein